VPLYRHGEEGEKTFLGRTNLFQEMNRIENEKEIEGYTDRHIPT
jgi:hypothetical protein